jgi:serine/threonine protein kinase
VPDRRVVGPEDAEAYLAEGRALARLDHPHIVPVYDVGRTDDGLFYVVSKYIEGSDLRVVIRQARPSIRESAEWVATIAEALNHAHARGLVHRDVKPSNILMDAKRAPFLADFGLALREEDYGLAGGRILGTLSYMSPEQARGEAHLVDGRADIFSLGIVLYELLTGVRPFVGPHTSDVLRAIGTLDPRPPRQRNEAISRELERICTQECARDGVFHQAPRDGRP